MVTVQNTLAPSSIMFPECENCWESLDLLMRPHKIELINKVTKLYLNLRLHAFSKLMTSSIAKTASKRQKLNKTILFYNM